MNLRKLIFTQNACYKAGKKITVKGIMVHSTGANNPWLKRYVGPDDGLLGKNQYNNHWNQTMDRQVCVHAFIGKLADGSIATYQCLPWDHRGWHGGGASNNTHIGFEICEDGLTDATYFKKVYQEAVELCAYLCKMYNLTEKNIICHSEGHAQGIASNHGDVMHWFPKHGKSMDTFRADVKALLGNGSTNPSTPAPSTPNINTSNNSSNESLVYNWLKKNSGLNTAAIAGILANLNAESGFKSTNLQQTYEKKLGYTDASYTAAVDGGSYDNFVRDSAGYGLIQWTYWSRKQGLLQYAQSKKTSIGDYMMQLEYMLKELRNYSRVWKTLTTTPDTEAGAYECGRIFCYDFEAPAAKETSQITRGNSAKNYFVKYKGSTPTTPTPTTPDKQNEIPTSTPFTVRVLVSDLNIRSSGSMSGAVKGQTGKGVFTIVETSKDGFGLLKSYQKNRNGWIYLENPDYVKINQPKVTTPATPAPAPETTALPYKVQITITDLNIRKTPDASISTNRLGKFTGKGVFTIVDEATGPIDSKGTKGKWGLLKSYQKNRNGWICLAVDGVKKL